MSTRILLTALALLILILSGGCHQEDTTSLAVPQGNPATIDGTLAPGEWDRARVEAFADGSELLLMYSAGHLYLGIRSNTPEMIVGNIFIHEGNQIRVLHTSAALGTALYQKGAESWEQTQTFNWRCRRTDDSAAAQAEREAFSEEEGWVSINSRMGTPNELEYRIRAPKGTLRLAANLLRSSAPDAKSPWPGDLDDGCVQPAPGGLPAEMQFTPDRWASIRLP